MLYILSCLDVQFSFYGARHHGAVREYSTNQDKKKRTNTLVQIKRAKTLLSSAVYIKMVHMDPQGSTETYFKGVHGHENKI